MRIVGKSALKRSSDAQHCFNCVANTGHVVATSERYTRTAGAEHEAQVIKDGVSKAPIIDETSSLVFLHLPLAPGFHLPGVWLPLLPLKDPLILYMKNIL